jgi:hypothetical protein
MENNITVNFKINKVWVIFKYRVFHDLWTLLQEVISQVFGIKKVHTNMCPIVDGYGVTVIFKFPYTPSCEPLVRTIWRVTYSSWWLIVCVASIIFATWLPQAATESSFSIWTLGWYLRNAGKMGWVGIPLASVDPYHVQWVQHLGPGDFSERLDFCKWLNGIRQ